jgi:hypothetical protein
MVFQFRRDRVNFLSLLVFFLVTGFILALYLNATPNEPRERDYIYVGSYLAFCAWIGLGMQSLLQVITHRRLAVPIVSFLCLATPLWMIIQNYDDHNRSGRTFQTDSARNLLNSCAPNAILFTGGDNDTFPLWYLQEVEGHRTDVRIVVLSYFNTDWYINQLRNTYYQSRPFALSLDRDDYRQYGPNDVLYVHEKIQQAIDVEKYLALLKEEHSGLRMQTTTGDTYHILPSRTLKIKVHPENVDKHINFPQGSPEIVRELTLRISENYLQKNALALLDLIVSNQWARPVYFNYTSLNTVGLNLEPYVVQEGNLFRLVPVENKGEEIAVNTALSYELLVEKADYTNLSNPRVYFNYEDYMARIITPVRQSFNALAAGFIAEGNATMATKTLQHAVKNLYPAHLEPSYTNLQAAHLLASLGEPQEAKLLCAALFEFYYPKLQASLADHVALDRINLYFVSQSAEMLNRLGEAQYLPKAEALLVNGPAVAP